ncbi:MAG: UDP-N-acetylglucosamine--N-acetylmuramyl-(pentapeptide) pyrophosphoryl-undecaprenol N-acetylglucosamine transferase [Dehalococcoidia bacterium]|nr:UDP-N-acetylglucosamine--N-acetylmuramyl-(pentapeptide) pyrophosphoryl-undecaprenol N-acetylglucosamine transferase [Dehalococcoidia bacterium]
MKNNSIVVSGGHTGGHIFPIISVCNYLIDNNRTSINFYGSKKSIEYQLTNKDHYTFRNIEPSKIRTKNLLMLIKGIINFYKTARLAKKYFLIDKPDAVFITGGFTSAPIGWAAYKNKIPLIIFCPDIKPGWAIRFLSKYAKYICCSVEESKNYLPKNKTIVTGYPLRKRFYEKSIINNKRTFNKSEKTLLIMGGSLGSSSINKFVKKNLLELIDKHKLIHVSGINDYDKFLKIHHSLNTTMQSRYELYEFSHLIPDLMIKSDLIISRAGASIFGELTETRIPALLYPGKFSDQADNARYLIDNNAAILLPNINQETCAIVLSLLNNNKLLEKMSMNMDLLKNKDSVKKIAELLMEHTNEK